MKVTNVKRIFNYGKLKLSDPNPSMGAKQVMNLYSNTYPELINATLDGPELKNNEHHYTFKTIIGDKG